MQSRAAKNLAYKSLGFPGLSSNASEIAQRAVVKAKGALADVRRGNMLHDKGFGGKRDSALTIARKGRTNGMR